MEALSKPAEVPTLVLATRRLAIVAVDGAFFHDEEDPFGLADVFGGVSGDGNDVG